MDRQIKKKKWTLKNILIYSIAALFVIIVFYNILFGDHSSKLNVQTERITISTVTEGDFQEFIPIIGNVIPIKTIYLDAIEGGRVDTLYLEAGNFVQKGDKILKLTNTNLVMEIMYREAELFAQSNNLRNTRLQMEQNKLSLQGQLIELNFTIKKQKRAFERAQQLLDKNLISQEEFELARDNYEYSLKKRELTLTSHKQDSLFREIQITNLEISLNRMESNLEIVKQNMENLVLKAPVTGQLTSLNAEVGESKSTGQRLGQVDVLDGFKVRAKVDEHYIARIELGRTGRFEFAGENYKMIVKKIFPEVLEGRFEVDLEFADKEPEGIRRGQTLHIQLELGDLTVATLLPRGGFYQKTGGQWVYVVDESGNFAVKRPIRLGRQNLNVYEVLEGLKVGEKVITSSYDNFGDIEKLLLK